MLMACRYASITLRRLHGRTNGSGIPFPQFAGGEHQHPNPMTAITIRQVITSRSKFCSATTRPPLLGRAQLPLQIDHGLVRYREQSFLAPTQIYDQEKYYRQSQYKGQQSHRIPSVCIAGV